MKILLDANISCRLTHALSRIFGECAHVDFVGLDVPSQDIEIWNYAFENDYILESPPKKF